MTYSYPLSVSTLGSDEIEAVLDVLYSGHTTMGERVEEFEEAFARYVGAEHAVMVNSGSSADLLMALATRDGDPSIHPRQEVLISAVTWPTHVWAHVMAGYKIRFVDVDGLNTTNQLLMDAMGPWTSAISLVHLMGIPAEYPDCGGVVTEDCCEALGSRVGGWGTAAAWSFFFSHQMSTMEGGAVTTNSLRIANELRSLRAHGWARHEGGDPYKFIGPGFNLRPTEISAAIGLVQLGRLDEFNKLRAENRSLFIEHLQGCPGIEIPDGPPSTSWFGLPFFVDRGRDELSAFLQKKGVETRPILGGNLTRQPAFARWADRKFPGADRVHDHGLFVGLHPKADSGVEKVAQLIMGFMSCA